MTEKLPPGHVVTNFKDPKPKKHVSAQKRREGNSEAHLSIIRQLPCCICGAQPPNDPHHLKLGEAGEQRAFGRKATDKYTIPLCRTHHDLVEEAGTKGEEQLMRDWGLSDPIALALKLHRAQRDVATMRKLVLAHHWGMT